MERLAPFYKKKIPAATGITNTITLKDKVMLLKIKKQIEQVETLELTAPIFLTGKYGEFYKITEDGHLIYVSPQSSMISVQHPDGCLTESSINEAYSKGTRCSAEQFNTAFSKALETLTAAHLITQPEIV